MALSPALEIGLPLFAAHLLGDFVFQTDKIATEKHRFPILATHALIHGVLAYVLIGAWTEWRLPLVLTVVHGFTDFCKARARGPKVPIFYLDQAAHLAAIVVLSAIWSRGVPLVGLSALAGPDYDRALVVLSGAVLCVRAASFCIGYAVEPYLNELQAAKQVYPLSRGLTNGGRVIGQWERALIFLFIGAGQPAAVGFLIAAKSVFRFGELKDRENRMEAEYITIGTLMSFGVAYALSVATFALARTL